MKINITKTIEKVESLKFRSKWQRAVQEDAVWLLEEMMDIHEDEVTAGVMSFGSIEGVERVLRMGADTWKDFSEGGGALIYDGDIAKHYCTPSELKKVRGGEKEPNKDESWLDLQARALWQAAQLIKRNLVTE